METIHIVKAAWEYATIASNMVATRAQEAAYARNQPGSSGGPFWKSEDTVRAMAEQMDGARHPEFSMRTYNAIDRSLIGWNGVSLSKIQYGSFRANIQDTEDGAWTQDRLALFFNADGTLMGAHSSRYRIHIRAEEHRGMSEEFLLGMLIGRFQEARIQEVKEREVKLTEANKKREERGLPPFENFWHFKEPTRYEARRDRKSA